MAAAWRVTALELGDATYCSELRYTALKRCSSMSSHPNSKLDVEPIKYRVSSQDTPNPGTHRSILLILTLSLSACYRLATRREWDFCVSGRTGRRPRAVIFQGDAAVASVNVRFCRSDAVHTMVRARLRCYPARSRLCICAHGCGAEHCLTIVVNTGAAFYDRPARIAMRQGSGHAC